MYATCTFCQATLGRNETLEHFPVGRRLAFDQARGRLWVVCPSCRLWNLSPLEIRWEAIEEAERLYFDARKRVSTENIGLARVGDGVDLVRVGEPLRPEFAAWRYGERFGSRRRRHLLWTSASVASTLAYWVAGPVLGLTVASAALLPYNLIQASRGFYDSRRVVGKFHDAEGPFTVNYRHLNDAQVVADRESTLGWRLRVTAKRGPHPNGRFGRAVSVFKDKRVEIVGADAEVAMRQFLPVINRVGGKSESVALAVRKLEHARSPHDLFLRTAQEVGRDAYGDPSRALAAMPLELRLALEMAAHEDAERRALEGELAQLEATWKEAEEIAAIADQLTLPAKLITQLERLGRGR